MDARRKEALRRLLARHGMRETAQIVSQKTHGAVSKADLETACRLNDLPFTDTQCALEADRALLSKLYEDGSSVADIATRAGVNYRSMHTALERWGYDIEGRRAARWR